MRSVGVPWVRTELRNNSFLGTPLPSIESRYARRVVTDAQSETIPKCWILCSFWRCNSYRLVATWIQHEFDAWRTIGQLPSFGFLHQFSKQILASYFCWFTSSVLIDRMCFLPNRNGEGTVIPWKIFRLKLSDIYCCKSSLLDSFTWFLWNFQPTNNTSSSVSQFLSFQALVHLVYESFTGTYILIGDSLGLKKFFFRINFNLFGPNKELNSFNFS